MLLRLEANGFKNLIGFDTVFGPFNCIAGENGVGKSNVFDAVQFLSLASDRSLLEAAEEVRSSREDSAGEPEHLFTSGLAIPKMRLAVEMVVPKTVVDDFGTIVPPSITMLRYELQLGYEPPTGVSRQGRLVVDAERLVHINRGDAHHHLRFPLSVKKFRDAIIDGRRSGGPFISTESDRITVHQDGGSRGRPRRALPTRAGTTVVSTVNSADDPTVLAARREMQSWRRLALEPTALRAADRYVDPRIMTSDGKHLAATLYRIATESPGSSPDDVYARIATRLGSLAGVDIRGLRVDADDTRRLFSVMIVDGDGRELPARLLSEGTLRYLALCVLLEDQLTTGLLMMEEPENGIHPANLPQMVDLVKDLAVDPMLPPGDDNPLRQVIVNTHSPGVVQLVGEDDLLVATDRLEMMQGRPQLAVNLRGMRGSWRGSDSGATRVDLLPYLVKPPGTQISLFDVAVIYDGVFLADGPSDLPLARHLEQLCELHGAAVSITRNRPGALGGERADRRKPPDVPEGPTPPFLDHLRPPGQRAHPNELERIPDPKKRLAEALLTASEARGRRRQRFQRDFPRHRSLLLERLDLGGPVRHLTAWRRLQDDIRAALTALKPRRGAD